MRIVTGFFWFFLLITFSQADGEEFFQWTDDAGKRCYSNVSPPASVKEYSVDIISRPAPDRRRPAQGFAGTNSTEKMPVKTDGARSGFSVTLLEQRIAGRKRSIDRIEALLQKHPNDPALRKSLSRKKQYLSEDLIGLKNIR